MTELLYTVVPIIVLPIVAYAALRTFPRDELERTAAVTGRLAAKLLTVALALAVLRGAMAVLSARADNAPDVGWLWSIVLVAGVLAVVVGSFAAAALLASRRPRASR